jgi:uncharacterized damage-inducible protein DinB
MHTTLLHQYQLVISARAELLNFCAGMNPQHLHQPVAAFQDKSIALQMHHTANVYMNWLIKFALQDPRPFFDDSCIRDIEALKELYARVDLLVNEYLQHFSRSLDEPLNLPVPDGGGQLLNTTPLHLFTHVITHEFHHKGQIQNMIRQLGYTPVDTDALRT